SSCFIFTGDGDLASVKKYIEEDGISIDTQDENGYSALHAAASYGHKELIKYLLGKGANVNIQDPDGDSPLFVCETVEIAKILID
ncbi:ankyrin repeat-containing domain protein, partial [Lobosporangium transversale]